MVSSCNVRFVTVMLPLPTSAENPADVLCGIASAIVPFPTAISRLPPSGRVTSAAMSPLPSATTTLAAMSPSVTSPLPLAITMSPFMLAIVMSPLPLAITTSIPSGSSIS